MDKEALRCLRFLAKGPANLEWPCRNESIPWLIRGGYAQIKREYSAWWNQKPHKCAEIIITDAGKSALQQTPGA